MSTPYEPAPMGQPASQPPPSNLVWGILTTIFCCLPAGIASIVFAAQVNSKWSAGDFAGAQASSNNARKWAIIGAVVGLVVSVLYVIAIVAGIVAIPEG